MLGARRHPLQGLGLMADSLLLEFASLVQQNAQEGLLLEVLDGRLGSLGLKRKGSRD